MQSIVRLGLGVVLGMAIMAVILLAPQAFAQDGAPGSAAGGETGAPRIANEAINANHWIQYQAQLFNPNNGQPQANQTFTARFTLYGDPNGNNALWSELKQVTTNIDGTFNTQIGDTEPLNLSIFDGRDLYLGVRINGEEPRPLQPISYAPYAIYARNADSLDGFGSSDFTRLIAYGFVNEDGSKHSGTNNFSSRRQTLANGDRVYYITISGIDFYYKDYITLVTPACDRAIMAGVGSAEGSLIVDIFEDDGDRRACNFSFVVYPRP
jgi:hypothetical protein